MSTATVTDTDFEEVLTGRIQTLNESSEQALPFQGRDLALVGAITLIIPFAALIVTWFAWV